MDITTIQVTGTDAIEALHEHRASFASTGLYPFLIGGDEDLGRIRDAEDFNEDDPATRLRRSESIDIDEWTAARRSERDAEEDPLPVENFVGTWPGEIRDKGSIGIHKDVLTGKTKPIVHLGLARITHPWELPAAIRYGGWNDCPMPEVHCAFHRKWLNDFGAEITGTSGDVIECLVARPPKKQQAALELAWQQYWYCTDIVEQGCETLSNLAATLLNSPYWYFWWD
jgi:hypothetical protein